MAQLLPNTVIYDQIIHMVSRFLGDYRQNKFTDNKQISEEYNNLISFLNEKIGRTNNRI